MDIHSVRWGWPPSLSGCQALPCTKAAGCWLASLGHEEAGCGTLRCPGTSAGSLVGFWAFECVKFYFYPLTVKPQFFQFTTYMLGLRASEGLCESFMGVLSVSSSSPIQSFAGLQSQIFWGFVFLVKYPNMELGPFSSWEEPLQLRYLPFYESPTQEWGSWLYYFSFSFYLIAVPS